MAYKLPSLKNITLGIIGAFFLVQILSVLINSIFPSVPLLKGGNAIFLMLLAVGIMSLFIIGTNIEQLKKRESLVFIVLLFAAIGLLYWQLPSIFPNLFQIAPEIANSIKQTIGSILG